MPQIPSTTAVRQRRRTFIAMVLRRARPGSGTAAAWRRRRTWSLPVADLGSLIHSVPFAVVGGVATRLYMPERHTLDLDILVAAEDAQRLHAELRGAGCTYRGALSVAGSQWLLPDGTSLDVLESAEPWAAAALRQVRRAPDGLPVVDLPYLVLLKLSAGRTQDLADVSRMMGAASAANAQAVRQVVATHLPDALEDLESLMALGRLEDQGEDASDDAGDAEQPEQP